MGKRIISQRRGRGTTTYRAPSFKYIGEVKYKSGYDELSAEVIDLLHCRAHSAPLLLVKYKEHKQNDLCIASEGIKVGDVLESCGSDLALGNVLLLKDIPEGTNIFNIEGIPGDGGKFIRSSGGSARILMNTESKIVVQFPSRKTRNFSPLCKATIGVVAGGGRTEKPLVKAGNNYYKHKAKNKLYPSVSGGAMNAVDHPFGNKRTARKAKAKPTSKNAPPGRKVGAVGARRTGRKKR